MTTPLASKTTVSSRNKMAAPGTIAGAGAASKLHGLSDNIKQAGTTITTSRLAPPRTTLKPTAQPRYEQQTAARLAATSSRIALPRSRLSGNSTNGNEHSTSASSNHNNTNHFKAPPAKISATPANRNTHITSAATVSRLTALNGGRNGLARGLVAATANGPSSAANAAPPSFANSRSSSKVSSISSSVTRQSSLTSAQANTARKQQSAGISTNYIPDTNAIRKGLAKFSNPIECQRQFQALNSEIRQLKEINDNKDKKIDGLQEQLQRSLDTGVSYATVVQYFAKKLKIDSKPDLETECEHLKTRVETLMVNETEYENKLAAAVDEYKGYLKVEQDLRASLNTELEDTRTSHSKELERIKQEHAITLEERDGDHEAVKSELESRVATLETDLTNKTKDLAELRKEYEILNDNFNKLEESLTKDKDARVKYFQEKVGQLQKDVDSLNSVLEMRTERIHMLEKDSILLNEVQGALTTSQDQNKALKQQLESLQAALENKRVQFENLFADHEKISQELKRERKERRRMTMRSEQLEFVLNESCATENNITVLDSSKVETT